MAEVKISQLTAKTVSEVPNGILPVSVAGDNTYGVSVGQFATAQSMADVSAALSTEATTRATADSGLATEISNEATTRGSEISRVEGLIPDAPDFISADANNALTEGTDGLLYVPQGGGDVSDVTLDGASIVAYGVAEIVSGDMVSADAGNALQAGSDNKLFVPTASAGGVETVSIANGETLIAIDNTDTTNPIIASTNDLKNAVTLAESALQSFTETDPVYNADKPYIALKTEIPDVSSFVAQSDIDTSITAHDADNTAHSDIRTLIPDVSSFVTQTEIDTSITAHNSSGAAHSDIRTGISSLDGRVTANETDIAALTTRVATNEADISEAADHIDDVEALIPTTASASNLLVDKATMDDAVTSMAAHWVTYDAQGNPFSNRAALDNTTTFYYRGQVHVPTEHDECSVTNDETHNGEQWTYGYDGAEWFGKKKVNPTPFTPAQQAAIDSGATVNLISLIGKRNSPGMFAVTTDVSDISGFLTGDLVVNVGTQTITISSYPSGRTIHPGQIAQASIGTVASFTIVGTLKPLEADRPPMVIALTSDLSGSNINDGYEPFTSKTYVVGDILQNFGTTDIKVPKYMGGQPGVDPSLTLRPGEWTMLANIVTGADYVRPAAVTTSGNQTISGNKTFTGNINGNQDTVINFPGLRYDSTILYVEELQGINDLINVGHDINMNENRLRHLPTPTSANDATNKAYVDTAVANAGNNIKLSPHLWPNNTEVDFGDGSFGRCIRGLMTYRPENGTVGLYIQPNVRVVWLQIGGSAHVAPQGAYSRRIMPGIKSSGNDYNELVIHDIDIEWMFEPLVAFTNMPYIFWAIYTKQ